MPSLEDAMSQEPEITQIAAYIANHVRTEGVDHDTATETWRHALRYARRNGVISDIAKQVSETAPDDALLQEMCSAVIQ